MNKVNIIKLILFVLTNKNVQTLLKHIFLSFKDRELTYQEKEQLKHDVSKIIEDILIK